MSKQARKVRKEAILEWAEGLYYNKGLFKKGPLQRGTPLFRGQGQGQSGGVVLFSFEMLEAFKQAVEEDEEGRGLYLLKVPDVQGIRRGSVIGFCSVRGG